MKLILKEDAHWLHFSDPEEVVIVAYGGDVAHALTRLESALSSGRYIAGFLSYELASKLDSALVVHYDDQFPQLCFGIYKKCIRSVNLPQKESSSYQIGTWQPSTSHKKYLNDIKKIKNYIAQGDTYQVNYTMQLKSSFSGDAYSFFKDLTAHQKADYAAFVEMANFKICSVSPELFFRLEKNRILARPMKGTSQRGMTLKEDKIMQRALLNAPKEQAENLMIVDMIRNDLGRVAQNGSVKVEKLFESRKYPTIWQMTSDVTATTESGFKELVYALFPCASITGAPKPKTMEIINKLEQEPRKIYTGSIGYFAPDGKAQFNVAIRTALIEKDKKTIQYGVGSGVVWDSDAESEYKECFVKARILKEKQPAFNLLETMLLEENGHLFLKNYHLERLAKSAEYFDFKLDMLQLEKRLSSFHSNNPKPAKIRLLIEKRGSAQVEILPIEENEDVIDTAFAKSVLDKNTPFIYHKTTFRQPYAHAVEEAKRLNLKDLILLNSRGEVCETIIGNIVIQVGETFFTPPVTVGLLEGTFRQFLLDNGKLKEKVLFPNHILTADAVFRINSVRKWTKLVLTGN